MASLSMNKSLMRGSDCSAMRCRGRRCSLDEMEHPPRRFRKTCLAKRERLDDRLGNDMDSPVDVRRVGAAAAWIYFKKFFAGGYFGPVADHAAQNPIERRAHRRVAEMTDDEIL